MVPSRLKEKKKKVHYLSKKKNLFIFSKYKFSSLINCVIVLSHCKTPCQNFPSLFNLNRLFFLLHHLHFFFFLLIILLVENVSQKKKKRSLQWFDKDQKSSKAGCYIIKEIFFFKKKIWKMLLNIFSPGILLLVLH